MPPSPSCSSFVLISVLALVLASIRECLSDNRSLRVRPRQPLLIARHIDRPTPEFMVTAQAGRRLQGKRDYGGEQGTDFGGHGESAVAWRRCAQRCAGAVRRRRQRRQGVLFHLGRRRGGEGLGAGAQGGGRR